MLPTGLSRLKPDGIFGAKTQARVFEFQRTNGLVPDGIVGALTMGSILEFLRRLGLLPGPTPPTPTVTRPINQEILGMNGPSNLIQQVIPAKSLIATASFRSGVQDNVLQFTFAPLTSGRLGIFAAGKAGVERAIILLLPAQGTPSRVLIGITHTFGQGKSIKLMESLGWGNPLSPELIKFTLLKHVINRWGALMLASKKPMAYVQIVRAKGGVKEGQLGPFANDGPLMLQVLSEMATLTGGAFSVGAVEAFTYSSGIHELNPFLAALSPLVNLEAIYNIDPAKATSATRFGNAVRRQFLSGQTGGPSPGFEFLGFNSWKNEDLFNTPAARDQFEYLHNHCMPQYILHLGIQTS
jgi:hypothetical protein